MQDHEPPSVITPTDLLQTTLQGPVWSRTTEQLNLNLLRFEAGEGIPVHVNAEVDVVGVVVEGRGQITIGNDRHAVESGQIFVIPRGAPRAIRALSAVFAYVSCHQRRAGLMPRFPE